jgi:glycosyltransferase involved in cell wall biosynthesis
MQDPVADSSRGNRDDLRKPFVSIIIPTYNSGLLIEETLSSCLKICGVSLEILVIDDGSTDGTPDRVIQKFPSVKLHRLPGNSGSGSAPRNAGLAMAKGHYIKFLDHDDLIQPRGFKAEYLEAIRSDADLVMARWGVVPIRENGLFCKEQCKLYAPPDPERLIEAILNGERTPFTASVLYKRSYVADEMWDGEVAIIDDFDWFCRMAIKGGKATTVDAVAYFWRLHPNSIQGRSLGDASLYQKLIFARAKVYLKLQQKLSKLGQLTNSRKRLLTRRYYSFLRCFARYDQAECRLLLARIRQLDPDFTVDGASEPDPKARWLIRRFGLASFLAAYGVSRRCADAILGIRRRARYSGRVGL